MVKGLSSKTKRFSLLPYAELGVESIEGFVMHAVGGQLSLIEGEDKKDYELRVTVEVVRKDDARIGDKTYERLLKQRIAENGTSAWYKGEGRYLFDFNEKKFMWGNRDLYLTFAQQYELYGCLVLGEGMDKHMIYALRLKFGKDFLEGII